MEIGSSLRMEFLKCKKGSNGKNDMKLMRGLESPGRWNRRCHECEAKEDARHVSFCRIGGEKKDEWDELLELFRALKMPLNPMNEIVEEGRAAREVFSEEDRLNEDASNSLKRFIRGALPVSAAEELDVTKFCNKWDMMKKH